MNTLPTQSQDFGMQSLMFDFSMIERMNELAKMMSTSKVAVPAHFRNSPGDCLAVVMQAAQWGMNPFAVAQKTFNIMGVLGYEAQLVNAVIASRAPITGRIEYDWFGPWERVLGKTVEQVSDKKFDEHGKPVKYRVKNWTDRDEEGCGVRVWATFRGEDRPRELELLLAQARTRNSTLWAEDPRQQLAYLAVKRWARLHCPDVILGVYTPDELEDRRPQEKDMGSVQEVVLSPKETSRAGKVRAALAKTETVSLDDALVKIRNAQSQEELTAVGENVCPKLAKEDLPAARTAFKQRQKELSEIVIIDQAAPESLDALVAELTLQNVDAIRARAASLPASDRDMLEGVIKEMLFEAELI